MDYLPTEKCCGICAPPRLRIKRLLEPARLTGTDRELLEPYHQVLVEV